MKKLLAIILSIFLILSLSACSKSTTTTYQEGNPSVEKVSEGNSLFVSITNAKGEIEVTADKDSNHKKVNDILKGDKITNNKNKLFLNHIAYISVEDRWTATYNCDNIGPDATITFTPKDKTANLMGITCKFQSASASYNGADYDSITFSQDGTIKLNGADKDLKFSSSFNNDNGYGDININAKINEKSAITVKPLENQKYEITSDKPLSSLTVNYSLDSMDFNEGEMKEPITLSEISDKTANTFTITITDNKITIE